MIPVIDPSAVKSNNKRWRPNSKGPRSRHGHLHFPPLRVPRERAPCLLNIHGLLRNETSFQSLPAHLHNLLTVAIEDLRYAIHTKLYPKPKTRRHTTAATEDFSAWFVSIFFFYLCMLTGTDGSVQVLGARKRRYSRGAPGLLNGRDSCLGGSAGGQQSGQGIGSSGSPRSTRHLWECTPVRSSLFRVVCPGRSERASVQRGCGERERRVLWMSLSTRGLPGALRL
jgi:hypothetical protein